MDAQVASRERSFFLHKLGSPSSSSEINLQDSLNVSDVEGKLKNKFLSVWNNVKYGMKLKTNFSKESPVWLLGVCYRKIESPSSDITELGTDIAAFQSQSDITNGDDEGLEGFKKDFISKVWLTYRREFPILNGSNYSSDCGWGCMIRSGQMLIAQALVVHFLSRDWRWIPDHREISIYHRKIIKWFGDKPCRNSPLSLHSLVKIGESLGKKPGDWYGPGLVAHLFRQAFKNASNDNYEFDSLSVCVAQNCTVYIKDILEECIDKSNKWKSLILLIPVRLGADKFNSVYAPCLTTLFSIKQCIGIIGGRPKHSLYFIGYQDDKLIHLDPHYCQEVVDVWAPDFPLTTFHCRSPRKLHISKIDPSCCIGFYCATKEDFFNLVETVHPVIVPPTGAGNYPIFTFCDGYSCDAEITVIEYPPSELEYSTNTSDIDEFESEPFEMI
ncbi:cysteine protease ATG4D [Cylas formicarius]|uniref:cysteine protease ATG4D n=1 Tax=Cylas formicarius TaxID=197179 RepID=UPI002958A59A|nr:cysteine protease ATG4D [Cylas formicarius]XP_060516248.1 cysteine protease ATG4D [Cylas formicarius]